MTNTPPVDPGPSAPAPNRLSDVVAALLVAAATLSSGLWFSSTADNREAPAPPNTENVATALGLDSGAMIREALVFVHLSRGENPGLDSSLADVLIWLPAITAIVAFYFLYRFHSHLGAGYLILAAMAGVASFVVVFQTTPGAIMTAGGNDRDRGVVGVQEKDGVPKEADRSQGTVPSCDRDSLAERRADAILDNSHHFRQVQRPRCVSGLVNSRHSNAASTGRK